MEGGHDYTVGAGGVDKTRVATTLASYKATVEAFRNTSDGTPLGNIFGTGTGINIVADLNMVGSGFTSDNLRNGSIFVGVVSYADAGNPTINEGKYRMGVTSWQIYTGTSTPSPPGGTPTGYLTPTPGNANPGVYAPGQFGNTRATYLENGVGVQQFLTFFWTIYGPAGITFAANGTQSLRIDRGMSQGDISTWNWSDCGLINVAASVPPGSTYRLECWMNDTVPGPDVTLSTPLVVRYPTSYLTTEF
jgi:hypothetical protein